MRTFIAWVGLCFFLFGSVARAQDEERAQLHFRAGASYYEAGDYEEALEEFRRSHALSNRPELFYNFSLCYQQLGDLENATLYLERYLQEVAEVPNRANLELRLANLRERAARAAQSSPSTSTQAPATAGAPTSTAEPRPVAAETAAEEPAAEDGGGANVPAIVSFAGGGVGAAMVIAFGTLALKERNAVESGCGATRTCTRSDVETMDRYALVADIGLGVAVAGAALGVVFAIVGGDDDADEGHAQARLRVEPWANFAQRSAGASIGGRF